MYCLNNVLLLQKESHPNKKIFWRFLLLITTAYIKLGTLKTLYHKNELFIATPFHFKQNYVHGFKGKWHFMLIKRYFSYHFDKFYIFVNLFPNLFIDYIWKLHITFMSIFRCSSTSPKCLNAKYSPLRLLHLKYKIDVNFSVWTLHLCMGFVCHTSYFVYHKSRKISRCVILMYLVMTLGMTRKPPIIHLYWKQSTDQQ